MKENDVGIDSLDKQILQQMSNGINSHEDLAHKCNVTRSTIYRRVASLEKRGFIRRITRSVVDYAKLGIVTICFAFKINQSNQKRAFAALQSHRRVKMLWRAFGDHNAIFVAFCNKGEEGQIIGELKTILEKEYTIEGDIVHFDALVVKFGNKMVIDGRAKALYLWRRVYGERMAPGEGFLIEEPGSEPQRYKDLLDALPLKQRQLFWSSIWELANDTEKLKEYDIAAIFADKTAVLVQRVGGAPVPVLV